MRITLTYRKGKASMRMDIDPADTVEDVTEAAREAWGCGDVVLMRGYHLLHPGTVMGDRVSEGDVVHVMPDPFARGRWCEIRRPSGWASRTV